MLNQTFPRILYHLPAPSAARSLDKISEQVYISLKYNPIPDNGHIGAVLNFYDEFVIQMTTYVDEVLRLHPENPEYHKLQYFRLTCISKDILYAGIAHLWNAQNERAHIT